MMKHFWISFLQKERQVHLQDTKYEMASISAVIYIGASLSGLLAMLFAYPKGMDIQLITYICLIALTLGISFYLLRYRFSIWMGVVHIFLGMPLVALVIWAGHVPSGAILSLVYLLSSIYSFHFFKSYVSYFVVLLAGACFAYVAQLNHWDGWQAMTVLLIGCASSVGAVVNLMVKRLHTLATTDGLTGLFNRNTWDTLFEQEFIYLGRSKSSLSLMLIDLNDFKMVNDTQGHQAGDLILVKTAKAIKEVVRDSDVIARWGGDEFIILLRECNLVQAKRLVERLHKKLDGLITASVGITEYQPGDTQDIMLARADQLMYEEKAQKRQRSSAYAVHA